MPTAKELGIKPKKSYPMDLTEVTMDELDLLYAGSDSDSPQRLQIANEIDRRVIRESKGKKKELKKAEEIEYPQMDAIAKAHETLQIGEFAKAIPVGTINAHGKQKQSDGSWKYVGKGKSGAAPAAKPSSGGGAAPKKTEDKTSDKSYTKSQVQHFGEKILNGQKEYNSTEAAGAAKATRTRIKLVDKMISRANTTPKKRALQDEKSDLEAQASKLEKRATYSTSEIEAMSGAHYKRTFMSKSEEDELTISSAWDTLTKGKPADPIGTVRNGRKKLGEGKWVPVAEAKHIGRGKAGQKAVMKDAKDAKAAINVAERQIQTYKDSAQGAKFFSEDIKKMKAKIVEHKKKLATAQNAMRHVGLVKGEEIDLEKAEEIIAKEGPEGNL